MIAFVEGTGSGPGKGLADEIHGIFSADGLLSKSPDFAYRAEQQEMAVEVASALEQSSVLTVEAGTGVGKSLAYLIPAVKFAVESGKKAVISTHTINLQEQLTGKDIPIVRKLLGIDLLRFCSKGVKTMFAHCACALRWILKVTYLPQARSMNSSKSGTGLRGPRMEL